MILLDLLREHGGRRVVPLVVTSLVGGVLGAATVTVANHASSGSRTGGSLWLGLAYLAALGAMFACNRWAARVAVETFEASQQHLRGQLNDALAGAPLRTVERIGAERGRAVNDLTFVATAAPQLVNVIQQGAFVTSITVIFATVSGKALAIWLVTCGVMAWWFVPRMKRLRGQQAALSGSGGDFHGRIEELLAGFKRVKLDPAAGDALVDDIRAAGQRMYDGHTRLAVTSNETMLTTNSLFFALGFGLAVFAPASTVGLGPRLGYEMSILLALSIAPLTGLLMALPAVIRAESSLAAVYEVLGLLAEGSDVGAGEEGDACVTITLDRLRFAYAPTADDAGFEVGPLDLELARGHLVFVTGGNGSGKTTLMKMLVGLYPCAGRIVWDGRPVTPSRMPRYRGLFSAIFGGQHLFDRLYGLDVPRERVEALLDRFGIADAVDFDGERFGKLQLSSGQHMRLAMVVALLEDRPICVFDEWTANQDPQTTWMYYDVLLPELIAQGKTVIAVSHDDRFFERADHLIRLDGGRVAVDRRRDQSSGARVVGSSSAT